MKKAISTLFLLTITFLNYAQKKDSAASKSDTIKVFSYDDALFTVPQIQSEFVGGTSAFTLFLQKNLNSEVPKNNGAPAGKYIVEARFIVDKIGIISDIQVETNPTINYGAAEEVIRVLKLSPNWKPAMQNGIFVKSTRRQRVSFVVEVK